MLLIKRIFGSRDRLQLAISKYSGSNDARDETKQMPLPREARTRDEAEQDRAAIEEQGDQTDADRHQLSFKDCGYDQKTEEPKDPARGADVQFV